MEYCSNGDLGEHIKRLAREGKHADEAFVWSIMAQLISALFLCHTGKTPPTAGEEAELNKPRVLAELRRKDEDHIVLHRDLKPENVFLTNGATVKLGDFGLSRVLQAHDFASTYVGTPFYMSPELCSSERYSAKSDIWSLGCIAYELCAQEPPFNGRNHPELILNIKNGAMRELPNFYSKELKDLIKRCLRVSQDDRPDVAQLLQETPIKLARLRLHLDAKQQNWTKTQKDMEHQISVLREENARLKDVEKQIEMQWHAKATLAISQRVDEKVEAEKARLWQILEDEKEKLEKRFEAELEKRTGTAVVEADLSSMSLSNETSPLAQRVKPRKATRTPFTRAKTIAHLPGSPMDISPVKKTPLPAALTPSRKAPPIPRSPVRGRTLMQLAQSPVKPTYSPAKWDMELGDDMPSPFLRKGLAV